jgi:hypothetical protein
MLTLKTLEKAREFRGSLRLYGAVVTRRTCTTESALHFLKPMRRSQVQFLLEGPYLLSLSAQNNQLIVCSILMDSPNFLFAQTVEVVSFLKIILGLSCWDLRGASQANVFAVESLFATVSAKPFNTWKGASHTVARVCPTEDSDVPEDEQTRGRTCNTGRHRVSPEGDAVTLSPVCRPPSMFSS